MNHIIQKENIPEKVEAHIASSIKPGIKKVFSIVSWTIGDECTSMFSVDVTTNGELIGGKFTSLERAIEYYNKH